MKTSSTISNGQKKRLLNRFWFWILCVVVTLLAASLIFVLAIWINSPGRMEQFRNEDGTIMRNSISEKTFVEINGVRQGMFIRGKDTDRPVLLFVHGGPCFPEYFMVERYKPGLEDLFTVCYWEQRGGGLSYTKGMNPDSVTMQQLKEDTIAVSEYIKERFGQDKIYLMAHSGGSFFAIQAAAERPDLYEAYIGVAQIANQIESERRAYQYLTQRYQEMGDTKMLQKFADYPVQESDSAVKSFFSSLLRDQSMHALGVGTMRNMRSVIKDVFLPVLFCRAYTMQEKIDFWHSRFTFIKQTNLHDEILQTNLIEQVHTLAIPVYFMSGAYDMTVNHDLSQEYLSGISAPVKGYYTFENSAHSPLFEEPERMIQILMTDVLTGGSSLAD